MVCMINAQNNHILELMKIGIPFFTKELTKLNYNADGRDLIATQCVCPDTVIVYCEGLHDNNSFFNRVQNFSYFDIRETCFFSLI
jgi:hypothetical protein